MHFILRQIQLKNKCLFILLLLPVMTVFADTGPGNPSNSPICFIRVKDNLLTVKAEKIPLETILNKISEQAPIKIISHGSSNDPVSVDMEDVPLNEGLKQLTSRINRAFVYETGNSDTTASGIIKIFVFSTTAPHRKAFVRETLLASLNDENPDVREKAAARLADYINDDKVILHLTKVMLKDKNEKVLSSTAKALGNFNKTWVKLSVINALTQIGGKKAITPLKEALLDEIPEVREAAASALERIEPLIAD